ncbi:MAG: ornithine cyclodeaminase family protein [Gemmatimonadota bacterium]|nr:ornithine cyclodeaminase family protein [Gemmatimonadota bacterium]MDE2984236.1 ornithine cyclodeaminase family protein [Gemmatimonadota bacterium]
MNVRIVSRAEILSLITMSDAIDAMARAFGQLSAGSAEMPVRVALATGGGISLFMPARLGGAGERGAKVVSVFGENRARGLPSINGVILMLDDETGLPVALMDGGELTAIRTAAAAGLAARLLSRPDSRVLAIFGAGVQAPRQIEAMRTVRPIEEVRVVSRGPDSARRLASSLKGVGARAVSDPAEAVDGADIIVAVTTSGTPVFDGSALPAGTHVSGSGSFMPHMREVGSEVVTRARVVVEEREAALEEAGDLVIPIGEGLVTTDVIDADLGEIVNGDAPGGNAGRELTFFKSVGTAVQDVAIGAEVLRRAEAAGVGRVVGL